MIFVDSSAWIAVSDRRDGNHRAALEIHRRLERGASGRLVTTDFVLDETLTWMRKRCGAELVRRFSQGIDLSPSVQQLWVTPDQFLEAKELFLGQGSHSWSLTDCTSFVVMREVGIRAAFAFDRDFDEAGFNTNPV
jgi:uncharacterized protein